MDIKMLLEDDLKHKLRCGYFEIEYSLKSNEWHLFSNNTKDYEIFINKYLFSERNFNHIGSSSIGILFELCIFFKENKIFEEQLKNKNIEEIKIIAQKIINNDVLDRILCGDNND